jgi:hypothetical protein
MSLSGLITVAVNAVKQKIMCIVCSVVLFVLCPF